jgi:hypothetical protein
LAARIDAFEASWCYAKSTPAALHCGEFDGRDRNAVEAVGRKLKFDPGDFRLCRVAGAPPALPGLSMAAS